MTMWWQQNTCFGVFNDSWEGNKQLHQCMFHSADFFSIYTSCWKSARTKICGTLHQLGGDEGAWGADIFSNSRWDIAQLVEMDEYLPISGSGLGSGLMR